MLCAGHPHLEISAPCLQPTTPTPLSTHHTTDNDPRSSDRPRKAGAAGGGGGGAGAGGKIKPGFGSGKHHRHTPSGGDLNTCEPPSPMAAATTTGSGSGADSPAAAWGGAAAATTEVTDTLSLSHLSPAPISTSGSAATPSRGLSKILGSFKRRGSNKGSASPGVPSSPVLPGATPPPPGSSGLSFSASASSLSGAAGGGAGSQSPCDSLCRAGGAGGGVDGASAGGGSAAGAGVASQHTHAHGGCSKLQAHYSSSGDPDEGASFGSCYSDAMHSPSFGYQEGGCSSYGLEPTLNLQQVCAHERVCAGGVCCLLSELPALTWRCVHAWTTPHAASSPAHQPAILTLSVHVLFHDPPPHAHTHTRTHHTTPTGWLRRHATW